MPSCLELETQVRAAFAKHFAAAAAVVVGGGDTVQVCLCPGRTNLVGEHIDYNGFGVLPCAIARYTAIAFSVSRAEKQQQEQKDEQDEHAMFRLSLRHVDGDAFPARDFASLQQVRDTLAKGHHWTNYIAAALVGVTEQQQQQQQQSTVKDPQIQIRMCIGGNLPRAAGVSSSSSLVCAAALCFSKVLTPPPPPASYSCSFELTPSTRLALADMCAKAERLVGTAGGGMDQAAVLCSRAGYATRIEFAPKLSVDFVKLPAAGCVFLVAQSAVASAKAEDAPFRYNKRWFECRVATRMLRDKMVSAVSQPTVDPVADTLKDVAVTAAGKTLSEAAAFAQTNLPEKMSKAEVIAAIGQPTVDALLDGRCGRAVWDKNTDFTIRDRAVHVFCEAARVHNAAKATTPAEFGALMNESGQSCDLLYDCSCAELRQLVQLSLSAGALGARLTGAGWGGAIVALVPQCNVQAVKEHLASEHYKKRGLGGGGEQQQEQEQALSELLFEFEPVDGASFC